MSRKVETDFEFDKDKFAKLLQKAKGELMLKSFAVYTFCGITLNL